jgi:hypothetical protein
MSLIVKELYLLCIGSTQDALFRPTGGIAWAFRKGAIPGTNENDRGLGGPVEADARDA